MAKYLDDFGEKLRCRAMALLESLLSLPDTVEERRWSGDRVSGEDASNPLAAGALFEACIVVLVSRVSRPEMDAFLCPCLRARSSTYFNG